MEGRGSHKISTRYEFILSKHSDLVGTTNFLLCQGNCNTPEIEVRIRHSITQRRLRAEEATQPSKNTQPEMRLLWKESSHSHVETDSLLLDDNIMYRRRNDEPEIQTNEPGQRSHLFSQLTRNICQNSLGEHTSNKDFTVVRSFKLAATIHA